MTFRKSSRSVFLFDIDAECEPRELIAYILRDIGIAPGRSSSEMHEQLNGRSGQRDSGGAEIRGRDRRGTEPVGCCAGKSPPAHQLRDVHGAS